ncbi:MAG: MerR family transcriptional regulator [Candidatus Cloacimonetes bacterium]|nr:MerR family transcriptional regulator [Candidatus Cloacimonadota bacterium]
MSKFYYTIGEVGNLLDLKPYVIRYWETEFPQLRPRKDRGRNRQFTEEHIELLRKIKDMLYNQKFTIDGARQKLKQDKKMPEQMEIDIFSPPPQVESKALPKKEKEEIVKKLKDMKQRISGYLQNIKNTNTES